MRKHGPAGAVLRRTMRRKRGRTQTEWRQGPGCERWATFERSENGGASTLPPAGATTGQPGFAAGEMRPNGSKGRGFAVGDPARRSRDGNGKTAVRGGEAMAAKRTTAQGGFAQRNAAPDFARQTQKAGPVTGQRGFAAGHWAALSLSKNLPRRKASQSSCGRSRRNRMKIRHFRGHAPWNQPALRSGVGAQSASSQKGVSRRKRVSRGTSPTSSAAAHSLSMVLTTADSRQRYTLVGV